MSAPMPSPAPDPDPASEGLAVPAGRNVPDGADPTATAYGRIRSAAEALWQRITPAAVKVPEITLIFWLIKVLTTAMGEVTSDFLVYQIDPVIAVIIGGLALLAAMALQLLVRRYLAPVYWLAVAMVAVFGTMAADVLHIGLGIPYVVSSSFFAIALAVIFAAWYLTEKTLSIHSIYKPRRELFYWAAVMATFALGTAAGDMTATTMGLGYFDSGVMFGVLFVLPALAYKLFGLNAILAFWTSYVLTRPFGASFADWAGKAPNLSGLGLGTGEVSIALTIVIVILVGYVTITGNHAAGDEG
jgi:uncharacterized membrane-anchored protein